METKIKEVINSVCYAMVFIVVLGFSGCSAPEGSQAVDSKDQPEELVTLSDQQIESAGIVLGKIEDRQISATIKANGVLDVPPQQLVSISAPLGGFLKSTDLLQGSRVRKGQPIATIENLDFIQLQQDYLEAKGNFEFATVDYERQQTLAKDNVNSQKALQQAKSNYTTWNARFRGLQEKLKMLNINPDEVLQGKIKSVITLYSPITGYVTQINVNIGKFVNPSDVLFEIVDTEHLHAELIVFEKDVPRLKIGQKVRFTLANETSDRLATIYLIGREISADRTIRIHCHIDKEDKEMLPGMYLNAVVETGGSMVPALPDEAVVDFQGSKYVFIVPETTSNGAKDSIRAEANQFQMKPIETGSRELGFTEIKTAISPDVPVVVKGAYVLLSKLKNSEEDEGQ